MHHFEVLLKLILSIRFNLFDLEDEREDELDLLDLLFDETDLFLSFLTRFLSRL